MSSPHRSYCLHLCASMGQCKARVPLPYETPVFHKLMTFCVALRSPKIRLLHLTLMQLACSVAL